MNTSDGQRRSCVVIGLFGTVLDNFRGRSRWERWRPTLSICQHDDLLVDRLELLHPPSEEHGARALAADITSVSPETDVQLRALPLEDPWDFAEVYGALHDFARSYSFDEERCDYLIHVTTGTHVAQICLFLLSESRHLPARLLQTSPPPPNRRRQGESVGGYSIIDLDLSRYDALARRFDVERADDVSFLKAGIETRNAGFNAMVDEIEHVALHSREPILLGGPTGVGKTRLARRIHELQRRRRLVQGELVEVNCATLRGDAAMSALFGHAKGAFTGAVSARSGLLTQADGGVLFLDEIGELGLDEQAMLLHAIEDRRYLPVGSDRPVESDFRLIAGTNRPLHRDVANGAFRGDLLARIDLWTFVLPSLRERVEDIEPNLDFELERFSSREGRQVRFNREGRRRFTAFASAPDALWPGNFRDFRASLTRMATLAAGGRIDEADVRREVGRLRERWSAGEPAEHARWPLVAAALGGRAAEFDHYELAQLEVVLESAQRNPTQSAVGRELFAVSRREKATPNDSDRVAKILRRFGLRWSDVRSS